MAKGQSKTPVVTKRPATLAARPAPPRYRMLRAIPKIIAGPERRFGIRRVLRSQNTHAAINHSTAAMMGTGMGLTD
jgi:hypothetical protein